MRRIFIALLILSNSLWSLTWSFQEKSAQEMTACELEAFKSSMWLRYLRETAKPEALEDLKFEILQNFKGILDDIDEAYASGKLTPEVLKNSSDVNLVLLSYESYAREYKIQDILDGIIAIEQDFPDLLTDVCNS